MKIEKFKVKNPELYASWSLWWSDEQIESFLVKAPPQYKTSYIGVNKPYGAIAKIILTKPNIESSLDKLDDVLIIK